MTLDTEALDTYIRSEVAKNRFSGAVLVAQGRDTVFKQAYGLANKRYDVPNRVDTKFNLGSINKIFTKVAITQMIEKGRLGYDDLVGKFLPDLPPEIAQKVTVHHLLTHTSGLGHYWNERFQASIGNLRTVDDFVRLFIDDPLSFEPGERMQYSNAGYVVLGKIVEVLAGQCYYDYVRENIYEPAGMMNSDHYELDDPVPNLAIGYTRGEGAPQPLETRTENTFLIGTKGSPAGGGYSTLNDMLGFDIALEENKLLGPECSLSILRPPDANEDSRPSVVALAGGAPGLAAFFVKYYQAGYTTVILSNYDPPDAEPVEKKIREMIGE